jgi:hypothetical protein
MHAKIEREKCGSSVSDSNRRRLSNARDCCLLCLESSRGPSTRMNEEIDGKTARDGGALSGVLFLGLP